FILYLALQKRLLTRNKLVAWGCIEEVQCVLSEADNETHNPLFLQCMFTAQVWQKILHWLNIQREARRWDEEVLWANTHYKGKQARAKVYRMAVAASVYVVWQERNQRIFKQIIKTPGMLVRKIVQEVHLRGRKWARLDQVLQSLNAYPV
uniref:Orf147a protein n=1 Tax=Solanum tuberosum TaxID=4113 RepID=M1DU54_SOLTU